MIFDARVDGRTVRVEVRQNRDGHFAVTLDGRPIEVDYAETGRGFVSMLIDGTSHEAGTDRRGNRFTVLLADDTLEVTLAASSGGSNAPLRAAAPGQVRVIAPMPGKILRVLVEAGAAVADGQGLLVMEAMKMENELSAPRAGRVRELAVAEGQAVETGALLAILD